MKRLKARREIIGNCSLGMTAAEHRALAGFRPSSRSRARRASAHAGARRASAGEGPGARNRRRWRAGENKIRAAAGARALHRLRKTSKGCFCAHWRLLPSELELASITINRAIIMRNDKMQAGNVSVFETS